MANGIVKTSSLASPQLRRIILAGGVGVMPTDTMYGLVGSALSRDAVERIYRLRVRYKNKPMIILIGDWGDLKKLGIRIKPEVRERLAKLWPGSVSVVLPATGAKMAYLRRGGQTLAVRWPKLKQLTTLINQVGPLVAPSANLQGQLPVTNIDEAKASFGERIDFYVDWGQRGAVPSTLIKFDRDRIVILREGKTRLGQ